MLRGVASNGGGGGGGAVDSVNGQTGVVVLDIDDIGGVIADGVTITGDGTTGSPLVAVGTPGGSSTNVQFNNAGSFGGTDDFTYDISANELTLFGGTGSYARFNANTGFSNPYLTMFDGTSESFFYANGFQFLGAANTIQTGDSIGSALELQAIDTDTSTPVSMFTITSNSNPTGDLNTVVTIDGDYIYRATGTDVALDDGGTGASLSDPGADRIMFWDDSAGTVEWLTIGTNLSITGTTINASGGGGSGLSRGVINMAVLGAVM